MLHTWSYDQTGRPGWLEARGIYYKTVEAMLTGNAASVSCFNDVVSLHATGAFYFKHGWMNTYTRFKKDDTRNVRFFVCFVLKRDD